MKKSKFDRVEYSNVVALDLKHIIGQAYVMNEPLCSSLSSNIFSLSLWRYSNAHLQCSVFRVLRLLFCLERNRHFFRRVFQPEFYEQFIDIGHYVHELTAYAPLVDSYRNIIVS